MALYLVQISDCEIFESSSGFLSQYARDIRLFRVSNEFTNGDVVTHFLVHLDDLVAPESDKISRKRCTPTVALLWHAWCMACARRVTLHVLSEGMACIYEYSYA